VFVHVTLEHEGASFDLVSKMAPPFEGQPEENVGLQIIGTTHLFDGNGSRLASARASLE
jgi:hypothetical protein